MSYRWSAYITPKSPKSSSKSDFLFFFYNKIQFQSYNVCYKVSLYEKAQQQSCSITIPHLTVHRYRSEA